MTLSELISALVDQAQELNPLLVVDVDWLDDLEVNPDILIAHQPSWPFEYQVGSIVYHDPMVEWDEDYGPQPPADDPDAQAWHDDRALTMEKPKAIFIGEGGGQEYLRGGVASLLGWR